MTNRNRVRLSKLSLALSLALAAAPVFAQSTSAALGGRISGTDGKAVSGADVTITHVESGSVSHAMTGDDGRFSARGLRVGGPYKITISKDGATETRDNVYLALSETTNVDATLGKSETTTLAAVQVTATNLGSRIFSPTNMGAGTTVTRQQIEALPYIKRSI